MVATVSFLNFKDKLFGPDEVEEEKVKLTLEGFRSVYDEVVSDSQIKLGELLPYVKHLYVPKDECMRQFSLS